MKKLALEHILVGMILLSIIVRIYFILTVPIFDNDSILNLFFGKALATHGIIPKSNTLAALLIGAGFFVFGENILIGRLVELFAAIATIYLAYKMGTRFFDRRAGLFASFLVSYMPLHIFYSTISKVYSVLAFFVMLSLYAFLVGFIDRKPLLSLSSAIFLFLAFLCKTYAAIGIIPIVVVFLVDIIQNKFSKREMKVTFQLVGSPILLFAFLLALNILWKLPEFGLSFYRDIPADFLSAVSAEHFRRPWYSLMSFNSIALFTLLPLTALSIMNREEQFALLGHVIFVFVMLNIAVIILNPLNHAPRGFLPSIPLLCVIAGVTLSKLLNTATTSVSDLSRLSAVSMVAVLFVVASLLGEKRGLSFFFEMNTPQTILTSLAFIMGCFFVFQTLSVQITKNDKKTFLRKRRCIYLIVTPLLLSYAGFGVYLSGNRLKHHAKLFYPVFEAVSFAPSCNILGGQDLVNLFDGSSFPLISDLPFEDVKRMISGDVTSVFKKHNINNIIIGGAGCAIDEIILTGIGKEYGIPWPKHRQGIYMSKEISRIFDNGTASLYQYGTQPPGPCTKTDVLKHYLVPFQASMGGSKLYWLNNHSIDTKFSFCIENGSPTPRKYSIKVAEVPRVDIETVDFDRSLGQLFSEELTIGGFSRKEVDIDSIRQGRIGVYVRNLTEGIDYFIYGS